MLRWWKWRYTYDLRSYALSGLRVRISLGAPNIKKIKKRSIKMKRGNFIIKWNARRERYDRRG